MQYSIPRPTQHQQPPQFYYQPAVSQTSAQYISSSGQFIPQPIMMVPTARAPRQMHPQHQRQHQGTAAIQHIKSSEPSPLVRSTTASAARMMPIPNQRVAVQPKNAFLKVPPTVHASSKSKNSNGMNDDAAVAQRLLALSDHTLSDASDDAHSNQPISKITGKPKRKYVTKKAKAALAAAQLASGKTPETLDLSELGAKGLRKARLRDTTRRYACKICQKRFVSPSKLRRHMLVHSGIKQFGCRICHSRFGQKSALVVHLKRKHPEMLEIALQQMSRHDDSGSDTKHTAPITSTHSGAEEDVVSTQAQPPAMEHEEEEDDEEENEEDDYE